jgi:hypothetical protein
MVPACASEEPGLVDDPWEPDTLYPLLEDPPDTLPTGIRDWIEQRNSFVEAWKASYGDFVTSYIRDATCERFSAAGLY